MTGRVSNLHSCHFCFLTQETSPGALSSGALCFCHCFGTKAQAKETAGLHLLVVNIKCSFALCVAWHQALKRDQESNILLGGIRRRTHSLLKRKRTQSQEHISSFTVQLHLINILYTVPPARCCLDTARLKLTVGQFANFLLLGPVLCTAGSWETTLSSTHLTPVAPTRTLSGDNQMSLDTVRSGFWKAKAAACPSLHTSVENLLLRLRVVELPLLPPPG
jgi:hypothetical protein